ncbi:unnamed protein product [Mytilus coruscus]|uniref:B box-type domain-containing protein n=1 Tax=Mytilus coruscus TaxID=42192 RepID=A0A6J8C9M2_MYTCO|nr:unnamed protein product [Mytilus coruscus]
MSNNSESDTEIVDAISRGIQDDIPCGQIPSNVKIVPINFDFDNLVNESCSSGNITDDINIDRCIDNMDNTLAKRHPIVTLLSDIRRFDRDTLPVYANIANATFSPRFGSDEASTFFKLKLQEFNSTVKLNFREFLTIAVKEYADKLTTEIEQYWHKTSASINNGASIVRLNDNSATRDTKELSELDRIKQELEVLRQQTDKGKPISEMDIMKNEIDDLKNVLGNRYGHVKEETPLCDACERDKCKECAEFWCQECVEHLCTPCVVVHQKLKITSEHYVLPLYIKNIISAQILDIPVTCRKHSNQSVLFYCPEHKSVLCNLCKQDHHKQCRELEEIKDKTDSDSFIRHFKSKAEQVKGSLDKRIEERSKNKNLMQAEHDSIHDEIRDFCQEIKNKIDELQIGLVENLSHHHSKRIETVDDNIETLLKIQSSVKSIEHDIKNVRDHLTEKQHFVILVAL